MSVGASQPTSGTAHELGLAAAVRALGVPRPLLNARGYPGSPDLAWPAVRLAVFAHGCFWHGCACVREPRTNAAWWREKWRRNRRRDRRVARELRGRGWRVLVVYEHEDKRRAARRVARAFFSGPLAAGTTLVRGGSSRVARMGRRNDDENQATSRLRACDASQLERRARVR